MHMHTTITRRSTNNCCLFAVIIIAAAFAAPSAFAQGQPHGNHDAPPQHGQHGQHDNPAATQSQQIKSDLYLLDTCPVTGQKLGSMGEPVVKKIAQAPRGGADRFPHFAGEREVRFCCAACPAKFEADKDKYFAEIDKKMIEQQLPYYPLDTCIVMEDSKLGDPQMGEPVDLIYQNRLVRFCCKMCVKDFNKDPQKYLAKLDEAIIKKQREHYPIETCALMDKSKLGSMGEPAERIYGNRLVKFCCDGCIEEFEKNPTAFIQRLDAAWQKSGHMQPAHGKDHGHDGDHADHGHGHGDGDHGANPQREGDGKPSAAMTITNQTVDAACGACIYKMPGVSGCPLAVKIDGKAYLVEGAKWPNHDYCDRNCQAIVSGRIEGDPPKFIATKFEPKK